jgi:hypothetical protein
MLLRFIALTVMLSFSYVANSQQVKINEVMTANASAIMDPENYNFSEWIELYNSGNTSFVISGYFFSNDANNLKKWKIPNTYSIPANGYIIIWMDKLNTGLHTNFRARSNRELLILSGSDGIIVDSISVNYPVRDHSFGRNPDGSNVWSTFETPTPRESNMGNTLTEQFAQPMFNLPAGRYSSSVTITLQNPGNSGTIYYSIDGSDPTENSKEYNSPITLTRTLTVKARILGDGKIPSSTVVNTYFINEHPFTLPLMVSISTDLAYLWDSEIGIYVEGTNGIAGYCYGQANWNQDWERPAHFELFTTDGKKLIDTDAGIKIAGGCSRRFDQKSFAVSFRDKYGNDEIHYPLFNSKPINRFKSIHLRNSGDDNLHSQLHDGMIQTCIMGQMDLDYVGFTPSATYINGEYWGILNIREKTTEDYLYSNYGLDDDSVDMLERDYNVIAGSNEDYLEMLNYLNSHDLAISENYNYIKDQIDIESFIDYQIAEIFVANHDWPENNFKYWKSKRPGSKWRWIYYDTDFGFGLDYGPEDNTLEFATDPYASEDSRNPPYSTFVFRMLLNNEEFRNRFIDKFLVYLGSTYRTERTLAIIDSISNLMYTEITYTFDSWGGLMGNYNWWMYCKRNFATERPAYMIDFIRDYFDLQSPLSLKVRSNNKEKKLFSMNNVIVNDTVFDGKYFKSLEVRIKAHNSISHKFNHWEINRLYSSSNSQYAEKDQQIEISEQKELSLLVTSDMTITAFFDTVEIIENISINEICASNSTYPDESSEYDDWIELYNAGMDTVDLAGLFLTDNYSVPEKHMLPITDSDETLIYPGAFKLLWADGQPEQGLCHLDFKLDKDSGKVALVQEQRGRIVFLDSISYDTQYKNYSYGRYPDGANMWYVLDGKTPGDSNFLIERQNILKDIYINEFCTKNSIYADESDEYDDWIELYNAGNETINLSGLFLTDSLANPLKFMMSMPGSDETLIYPGAFKLLWADGQPEQGLCHLDFKLDKDGGEIALIQQYNGRFVVLDSVQYLTQTENYTYGRYADGMDNWLFFDEGGTPGESNIYTNISRSEKEKNIYIYPNPVRNIVKIILPGEPVNPIQVTIINSIGLIKNIMEINWQPEGCWIDFSELEDGLYYIRIQDGKSIINQKILKLK